MFEGEIKTFNVYQTQRKAQDGFGHWPVPYNDAEVATLLFENRHSSQVRELLAPEIMSLCKTGHLPLAMLKQFSEFGAAYERNMRLDIYKKMLFNEVLQNLSLDDKLYSPENFKKLVCDLKSRSELTPNERAQLLLLEEFQLVEEIKFIWFKHFCAEEGVFSMFVLTYLATLEPDASATPFTPSTALLDALLEATSPPIRLCIWELQPPFINHVQCIYLGGRIGAPVTHVLRNSDDMTYFELMADIQHPLSLTELPVQANDNLLKRGQAQYDPTLFGPVSSKRCKKSVELEEAKKDETKYTNPSSILK